VSRVVVALLLAATACGVRPDSGPHRIDASPVVTAPVAKPVAVTVYLVREGRLVPVPQLVVAPVTPQARLAAVADATVRVAEGIAVVRLAAPFAAGSRDTGTAQVVLTLTEDAAIRAVRIAVGSGRPGPALVRGDYVHLLGTA
jgi:hypothetical protein